MEKKIISIQKFDSNNIVYFGQAVDIRKKVFVEEQGVDPNLEYDQEENAVHFLLLEDNLPIACARYRYTNKGIKFERFAVLKSKRGLNYGSLILTFMLNSLKTSKEIIYLHAQIQVVSFYEKYGFRAIGSSFFEAGIEHLEMKYNVNSIK